MARTVYETRRRPTSAAVILELARSEQTYTFQRRSTTRPRSSPARSPRLARAGLPPGRPLPVQRQEVRRRSGGDDEEIRRACRLAIDAGYRNIDIDSSSLVDLLKATRDDQQRDNYLRAAELTALIRSLETDGVTVSVGGEIGEVGKENSNEEELLAYLDGYRAELERRAPGAVGISKVSVQTGTSHGGVPLRTAAWPR
jgi:hypothetical protein